MPVIAFLAPILIGVETIAAIGATVASIFTAATISTTAALAIGSGVVSAGVSIAQGRSISDSLKSAVIGGVVSFAGGAIAGEVTKGITTAATDAGFTSMAGNIGTVAGAMARGATTASISAAISGRDPLEALLKGGLTAGLSAGATLGANEVTSRIPGFADLSKDYGAAGAATQRAITAGLVSGMLGKDIDSAVVNSVLGSITRSAKDYFTKDDRNGGTSPIGGFSSGMGAANDFGLKVQSAFDSANQTGNALNQNFNRQNEIVSEYKESAADIESQRAELQGNLDKHNEAKNIYNNYSQVMRDRGFQQDEDNNLVKAVYNEAYQVHGWYSEDGTYNPGIFIPAGQKGIRPAYSDENGSAPATEYDRLTSWKPAPTRDSFLQEANKYANLVNDKLPGYDKNRTSAETKFSALSSELDGLKSKTPELEKTLVGQKTALDTSVKDFQTQEESNAQNIIKIFNDTLAAKTSVEQALGKPLTDEQIQAFLKTGDVTTAAKNYVDSTLADRQKELDTKTAEAKTAADIAAAKIAQDTHDAQVAQIAANEKTAADAKAAQDAAGTTADTTADTTAGTSAADTADTAGTTAGTSGTTAGTTAGTSAGTSGTTAGTTAGTSAGTTADTTAGTTADTTADTTAGTSDTTADTAGTSGTTAGTTADTTGTTANTTAGTTADTTGTATDFRFEDLFPVDTTAGTTAGASAGTTADTTAGTSGTTADTTAGTTADTTADTSGTTAGTSAGTTADTTADTTGIATDFRFEDLFPANTSTFGPINSGATADIFDPAQNQGVQVAAYQPPFSGVMSDAGGEGDIGLRGLLASQRANTTGGLTSLDNTTTPNLVATTRGTATNSVLTDQDPTKTIAGSILDSKTDDVRGGIQSDALYSGANNEFGASDTITAKRLNEPTDDYKNILDDYGNPLGQSGTQQPDNSAATRSILLNSGDTMSNENEGILDDYGNPLGSLGQSDDFRNKTFDKVDESFLGRLSPADRERYLDMQTVGYQYPLGSLAPQDLGVSQENMDSFNQNFNPEGGFSSGYQTVGANRIMINDDGTASVINSDTGAVSSLTREQVQGLVANGTLNSGKSGYVAATGGAGNRPGGTFAGATGATSGNKIIDKLINAAGDKLTQPGTLAALGGAALGVAGKAKGMSPMGLRSIPAGTGAQKVQTGAKGTGGKGSVRYFEKKATGGAIKEGLGYLKSAHDGMEDKINASIDNKRPAKLSGGEFVIPADVVSHLGNGNSEAGAKQLYALMERVRKARTGTAAQGKQIDPKKYLA